jgi:glycerol-3-phosphate acyltransferase PlsX
MMSQFIKQEFTRTPLSKLAALVAMPVLNRFKARVDHRRYSGGALLGLRGLVFKAHGASDAFAFERALARAYDAARNRLLDRVHDRIRNTLAVLPEQTDGALRLASGDAVDPAAAPPAKAA